MSGFISPKSHYHSTKMLSSIILSDRSHLGHHPAVVMHNWDNRALHFSYCYQWEGEGRSVCSRFNLFIKHADRFATVVPFERLSHISILPLRSILLFVIRWYLFPDQSQSWSRAGRVYRPYLCLCQCCGRGHAHCGIC